MVGVLPRTHDTHKVTWSLKWGPVTRNKITVLKSSTVSTDFLHDFLVFFVAKILISIKTCQDRYKP